MLLRRLSTVPFLRKNVAARFFVATAGSTFVSSHYQIDPEIMKSYLTRKSFKFHATAKEITVQICPFCHDTKGKVDNQNKLYISSTNGTFFCHRCNSQGSWFDFQKRLGDIQPISSVNPSVSATTTSSQPTPPAVDQSKLKKATDNLVTPAYAEVLNYLTKERKLTKETIAAYKVGAATHRFLDDASTNWIEYKCVTFPWLEKKNAAKKQDTASDGYELIRMKYRPVAVKNYRLDPSGGQWSLFGIHLVPPGSSEIILTEGEFDAMSVYQATGKPAVSLPNGAGSLPTDIIELLEPFKKIIFWMDDDVKGREGAMKFANKLGLSRCQLIPKIENVTCKDANEALCAGLDLKAILAQAAPIPHEQIMTFKDLREDIFLELSNPGQVAGVQSVSFPSFNSLLRGHRKGELTIFTGATGTGKTSILSQLSLDYCTQGITTLWGSFELQNKALAKKMLTQFAAKNLEKNLHDKFSELPLFFLKFYGTTSIDMVVDAMEYAVYAYDVEHIILDNLQFMTGSGARGFEKFDQLDSAIERFRKFATLKQVHVTLVVHPRKEADGATLSANSVFGSAKATQEADNVIIVQKSPTGNFRYLEVVKNRYTGDLGKILYRFDPENLKYYELTKKERDQFDQPPNPPNPPYYKKQNFA